MNKDIKNQSIPSFSNKPRFSVQKIIVFLAVAAVIGGGAYLARERLFEPQEAPEAPDETFNQPSKIETLETADPSEESTPETKPQDPAMIFADMLSSCVQYKATFEHPLTEEVLEKEILGIIDGKCNYVEQMPGGGKMECKYSESERIAVAQYYRDVATAESLETSLELEHESGEQETTYTIDGQVVDNPLQEALNRGSCVISGY